MHKHGHKIGLDGAGKKPHNVEENKVLLSFFFHY